MATYLDAVTSPDMLPFTRNLAVSDNGDLWIERYPMPGAAETSWYVLSAAGAVKRVVVVPATVRIVVVAGEAVSAIATDPDGVETVGRYRAGAR